MYDNQMFNDITFIEVVGIRGAHLSRCFPFSIFCLLSLNKFIIFSIFTACNPYSFFKSWFPYDIAVAQDQHYAVVTALPHESLILTYGNPIDYNAFPSTIWFKLMWFPLPLEAIFLWLLRKDFENILLISTKVIPHAIERILLALKLVVQYGTWVSCGSLWRPPGLRILLNFVYS